VAGRRSAESAAAGRRTGAAAARRIAELERKIGQQALDLDFFSQSLQASKRVAPEARQAWRDSIYGEIREMMQLEGFQAGPRLPARAGQSGGLLRQHAEHEPRQADVEVRDHIQRIVLENRCYGYRRVTAELGHRGVVVNHKRVLRLMRLDNLLAVRKQRFVFTTDSRHTYAVYPNLAGQVKLTAVNQLWVADITYVRLRETFLYLAIVLDAYSRGSSAGNWART